MAGSIDNGLLPSARGRLALTRRTCGDIVLGGVTLAELSLLVFLTPTFTALDWVYVLQHVIVLGIALTRRPPNGQDHSWLTTMACLVAYAYPYAQIIYLDIVPGYSTWPQLGDILVVVAAGVSLASLLTLGRWFGIRPGAAWPRRAPIGWCAIRSTSPISWRTSVSTVRSGMAVRCC